MFLICYYYFMYETYGAGYKKEFGSETAYINKLKQDSFLKQHQAFLASRKAWLKELGKGNCSFKTAAEAAKKAAVSVHSNSEVGVRCVEPQVEFVLLDDWDTKEYGNYKPEDIQERDIYGIVYKGIYRLKGKKGHYLIEGYQDDKCIKSKTEVAGDDKFAKEAARRDYKVRAFLLYTYICLQYILLRYSM